MRSIEQLYDKGKTGRSVKFELAEATQQAVDDYHRAAPKKPGDFLFPGRRPGCSVTRREYARLIAEWIGSIGLDPHLFGTHSLRSTKATLIYRRTGNLRAVQLTARPHQDRKYHSLLGNRGRPCASNSGTSRGLNYAGRADLLCLPHPGRFAPRAAITHMRASQTAKPPVDQAEAATALSDAEILPRGLRPNQRAAPYSCSSVFQFEGTAPVGPGTG